MVQNVQKVFILIFSAILITSCNVGNQNKNHQSEKVAIESFEKFSSSLDITGSDRCNQNCVNLKKEFRYVVYLGEKTYCYWDEKQDLYDVDFKTKAAELENLITDETTQQNYYDILTKWAALFRDGHVNAMIGDESSVEYYNIPIRFELLAPGTEREKLIISAVDTGVKKLKVGTVVNKIQNQDWKTLISKAQEFVSGSTLQMRRRSAANYIPLVLLQEEGALPLKVDGSFGTAEVSEVIARNLTLWDGTIDALDKNEPEATGLELIKAAILENNIGYLRIDGFMGSKMYELLDQAITRLQKTDGLIIDVRKNGGGDLSGDAIISRLIENPIIRFKQKTVFSDMLQALRPSILFDYEYLQGRFSELKDRRVKPRGTRYTKPVVVLTSAFCFSACDTFVSALQQNNLATVVGEATGGGTGGPLTVKLPFSGNQFRYSVVQGFTAVTNTLLEGAGTNPDVLIEPSVVERAARQDLQLEKTGQYLSELIASSKQVLTNKFLLTENLKQVDPPEVGKIPLEIEISRDIRKSSD
jgi:hypothetical protein